MNTLEYDIRDKYQFLIFDYNTFLISVDNFHGHIHMYAVTHSHEDQQANT